MLAARVFAAMRGVIRRGVIEVGVIDYAIDHHHYAATLTLTSPYYVITMITLDDVY